MKAKEKYKKTVSYMHAKLRCRTGCVYYTSHSLVSIVAWLLGRRRGGGVYTGLTGLYTYLLPIPYFKVKTIHFTSIYLNLLHGVCIQGKFVTNQKMCRGPRSVKN